MMRRALAPVALLATLLAGTPSGAEPWACAMTVRCEASACTAIDTRLEVIAADHAGDLFLTTGTGDQPVSRLSPRGAMPAIYASAATGGTLLSVASDGRASLTRHAEAPATSFGTCEVL